MLGRSVRTRLDFTTTARPHTVEKQQWNTQKCELPLRRFSTEQRDRAPKQTIQLAYWDSGDSDQDSYTENTLQSNVQNGIPQDITTQRRITPRGEGPEATQPHTTPSNEGGSESIDSTSHGADQPRRSMRDRKPPDRYGIPVLDKQSWK